MKKILLVATMLGTSVLSAAPMASADDFDGFWDKDRFQIRARAIGIFADGDGTVVPGGAKTDVTYSATPEVDLTYFVNKNVALELIAATAKHKVEAGGGELGKTWILPPTLTLQYHFTPEKKFSPYVGAGLNYSIFYGENDTGATSDMDIGNSLGYALQAGFDYWLDDKWGINADLKYIDIDADVSVAGGTVNARDVGIDPIIAGVGISYRF